MTFLRQTPHLALLVRRSAACSARSGDGRARRPGRRLPDAGTARIAPAAGPLAAVPRDPRGDGGARGGARRAARHRASPRDDRRARRRHRRRRTCSSSAAASRRSRSCPTGCGRSAAPCRRATRSTACARRSSIPTSEESRRTSSPCSPSRGRPCCGASSRSAGARDEAASPHARGDRAAAGLVVAVVALPMSSASGTPGSTALGGPSPRPLCAYDAPGPGLRPWVAAARAPCR